MSILKPKAVEGFKFKGKSYRFFYHYYKQYNEMSVHFKGKCMRVKNIECFVPCETKWKPTQPRLVMQGWATEVTIKDNKAYII